LNDHLKHQYTLKAHGAIDILCGIDGNECDCELESCDDCLREKQRKEKADCLIGEHQK